jgi:hypothetical protein
MRERCPFCGGQDVPGGTEVLEGHGLRDIRHAASPCCQTAMDAEAQPSDDMDDDAHLARLMAFAGVSEPEPTYLQQILPVTRQILTISQDQVGTELVFSVGGV